MNDVKEITEMLIKVTNGNKEAVNSLLPVVYKELKQMAQNQLRNERKGHTLNATALVHETYFKLIDQRKVQWQNKAHFFWNCISSNAKDFN